MRAYIILKTYNTILASRQQAREVIELHQDELRSSDVIVLDFNGIRVTSLAFASELIDLLSVKRIQFEIVGITNGTALDTIVCAAKRAALKPEMA